MRLEKRVLREVRSRCAVCADTKRMLILESRVKRTLWSSLSRGSTSAPFRAALCLSCRVEYPIRSTDESLHGAALRRSTAHGPDWHYPAA